MRKRPTHKAPKPQAQPPIPSEIGCVKHPASMLYLIKPHKLLLTERLCTKSTRGLSAFDLLDWLPAGAMLHTRSNDRRPNLGVE